MRIFLGTNQTIAPTKHWHQGKRPESLCYGLTLPVAVPARSALTPHLFREGPSLLYAGGLDSRFDCFAFLPFCQCVRLNSVLAQ
jgi:hypothetical protein